MSRRRLTRRCVAALAVAAIASAVPVATPAASAAPTAAAPGTAAVRVLYYDASQADEFVNAVVQGAEIWNGRVSNVRLQRAGRGDPVNIVVTADNGWPRAQTRTLGNGRIWMGRQAVNDGHHPPRIAAHEFGHLLGLPDRRTGRCADLMSGASAGISCRNAIPNSREISEVRRNFSGSLAAASATRAEYHVWECFPDGVLATVEHDARLP